MWEQIIHFSARSINMRKRFAVIGAGINGLMAANELARAGHQVALFERTGGIGGAARKSTVEIDDQMREYPLGATVFGHMRRFLFERTGLDKRVTIGASPHPGEYQFLSDAHPIHPFDSDGLTEMREAWGETGDIDGFNDGLSKVVQFLGRCYDEAQVPTLEMACTELGTMHVARFITGDAKSLMDSYLTSEKAKVVFAKGVVESGPVGLTEPWSALNLALADTGNVLGDGRWGYVKGGIWQITNSLAAIDRELGVEIGIERHIYGIDMRKGRLYYIEREDGELCDDNDFDFDHIVFATDPLTPAKLIDRDLERRMEQKRWLGTSGKLIALFREPVRWKNDRGRTGYDSAQKFLIEAESLEELDRGSKAVSQGLTDFYPGHYEIYCHGAGNRLLGQDDGGDAVMVFFKHLSDRAEGSSGPTYKHSKDLIRQTVTETLLSKIANPEALAWTRLLTPKDLTREFFFPRGNIEHAMICEGQTFFSRTYSAEPDKAFYRFGTHQNAWYCGAGSFPDGSVAGTNGYMCAQEILRSLKP